MSKWYGFSINLVCFVLIQVTLYLLLLKLTDNNRLVSSFTVALYSLNPTVIQYSLLIRMYMLLGVSFVFFAYSAYQYIFTYKNKYILYLFLATLLGGLTNYFYYVYLVIMCLLILLMLLVNKVEVKKIIKPVISIVTATCTNLLIFPFTLDLFFQEKNSAITAGKNFASNIINFKRVGKMLSLSPFTFLGTIVIVVLVTISMIYFLSKRKNKNDQFVMSLLITYILYFSVISTIAFGVSYRFVCAIDGLLIVTIGYVLSYWDKLACLSNTKRAIVFSLLYIITIPVVGYNKLQVMKYEPLEIAKQNEGGNLLVFTKEGTP